MTLSPSVIESIKKHLQWSDIHILANAEWGSQNPSHRDLIHSEVSKLAQTSWFSSASHSPGMGAVLLAPHSVGVDVEQTSRVQTSVVQRVSRQEEVEAAPSPASLWCAKEAAFKALRPYDQPSVISEISIGDWQKIDSQFETYRLINASNFNSPSENRGVIFKSETHTFSFFIFLP